MSRIHQIEFQLKAIQDNTFSKSFVDATHKIANLSQKMQNLNGVNISKVDAAKSKLHTLTEQVAASKARLDYLKESADKLGKSSTDLTHKWAATYSRSRQLKDAIEATNKPTKEQTREFERLSTKASYLREQIQKVNLQHAKAKDDIKNHTNELKKLEAEYETFERNSAGTLRFDKFKSSATNLLATAAVAKHGVSAIISASKPLVNVIHSSLELEKEGAQVRKNIHFHDLQEYQAYQKKWLAISERYAVSQMDIMHMAEKAAAGTVPKEEVEAMIARATKMGNALNGISFEQAIQTQIEWRSGMQMTQKELDSLTDAMVMLGDKSTVDADFLAKFTAQAGSQAKMMGLSAKQTMAFGSAIVGMAPEAAATSFKAFAGSLAKATSASKTQLMAFTDLGLNTHKIAKGMQKDAVGTINTVLDALEKVPEYKRASYADAIAGATGSTVLSQLLTNRKLINTQLDNIGNESNYTGRLDIEAKVVNESTLNKLEMMKNSLNNIQLTLVDLLMPAITTIIDKTKAMLDVMGPWIERNKDIIKYVAIGAVGLVGLSVAVKGVIFAFSGVTSIIKLVRSVAAAQWLWNAAVLANPITLIIGGIILALGLVIYKWDSWGESIKNAGKWIWDLAKKFNPLLSVVEKIGEKMGWLTDGKDKNININADSKSQIDTDYQKMREANKSQSNNQMYYSFSPTINAEGSTDPASIKNLLDNYGNKQGDEAYNKWMKARLAN